MKKLLLVQEYLLSGKTLEDLKNDHGVNSNITNNKVSLNYDQLESQMSDELACQCRGLVLENDTWEIIACPMFRFFNHGQGEAANIDWNTAKVFLKLDGTCLITFFNKDRWYVATRSRPEADIPNENGLTFSQLTDMTLQIMSQDQYCNLQKFMKDCPKDRTYVFELTTPLNQVYCTYENYFVTLLAVRNNITLEEEDPEDHLKYFSPVFKLKTPDTFDFSSISDMVSLVTSWNPKEKEGVVIRDGGYNRIKMKNPAYAAMSHLRDSLTTSTRNCIKIILLEKDDDIINDLPKFIADRIIELKEYIKKIKDQVNKEYDEIKDIDDLKYFASKAEFTLWPAACFSLKRGKANNIMHFMIGGNKYKGGEISGSSIDSVLSICKKLGYVENIPRFGDK